MSGYGTCFHLFRFMMEPIIGRLTPYLFARTYWLSSLTLMAMTAASVSLAFGRSSPRKLTVRPFPFLSLLLSPAEPRNRCAGLTHVGTSHLCRTLSPAAEGQSPVDMYRDSLWAIHWPPSAQNIPYPYFPAWLLPARHSQQPAVLSTLLQNLARSSGLSRGSMLFGFVMVSA